MGLTQSNYRSYLGPATVVPLDIPTYDSGSSVTHPSVVYEPGGWHGHAYWMAFTPYPNETRENPSIVVSDDGVNWMVPSGLTNPVVSRGEVQGLGYDDDSDTCLILNADKSALWLYYRPIYGTNNEGIFRKTSTDGITWSSGVSTGLTNATNYKLISPAVVLEDDNTYSMWVVDDTAAANASRVVRRTSSDGINWSAGTVCTMPTTWPIWHIDIKLVNGVYYMLGPDESSFRLRYLSSSDGLSWSNVISSSPAVPISGYPFDIGNKNYKSCFVATDLSPSEWKMWIVGIDGPSTFSDNHRIVHYEGSFAGMTARPSVSASTAGSLTASAGSAGSLAVSPRAVGTLTLS